MGDKMFKFLDNKSSGTIGDTLKEELQKGTKLSINSAYLQFTPLIN